MKQQQARWSTWAMFVLTGGASLGAVHCGFSDPVATGTAGAGAVGNPTGTTGGSTGMTTGGSGQTTGGSGQTTGGSGQTTGGSGQTTGGSGQTTGGSGQTTGGTGGNTLPGGAKNYQRTGTWPNEPLAIAPAPGSLTFDKVELHARFLAESCAIADYNNDGTPDVSAGRRWYEGPFGKDAQGNPLPIKEHIFRGGHDDLPRAGTDPAEIDTGVSDDWADAPFDMDKDGNMDIINIANCDVAENKNPNPKPSPQPHATAYWYKNPGPAAVGAAESMWESHVMHSDVRLEQHGLVDVNGDGYPEIYGACKSCNPEQTKGYYQGDPANPTAGWVYHAVTKLYTFPFGGTGWLHGEGFGDVNGDGTPDLLERGGVWINPTAAAPNVTPCTPGAPQAGCGWMQQQLWDGNMGEERGASHMYAYDVDGDGDADIATADGAHHWGLSWYEQTAPGMFTKRQYMGSNSAPDVAKYGPDVFSEPHAFEVADMDGDGVPDVVTGKMRFAHPVSYGDPDPMGAPVLYVFKTKRNTPSAANGGSVTMEPHLVDNIVGVGRKLSVGQINTDGKMDICVSTKVGLYVFLQK